MTTPTTPTDNPKSDLVEISLVAAPAIDPDWLAEVREPELTRLDKIFGPIASRLPLCGNGSSAWEEGKSLHWSVRIADAIIPGDGCGCCAVWRSLMIGAVIGALGMIQGGAVLLWLVR